MTDPGVSAVNAGQMRLYDSVRPALPDDTYRLTATTTTNRNDPALPAADGFFEITGPRFALGGDEVVAVYPPRNAQGSFDEVFPQIVLGRRTLPWERELDPDHVISPAPPSDPPDDDGPLPLKDTRAPWLALLLFVDDPQRSEVEVLARPVPVSQVITDATVLGQLHLPDPSTPVNAIEVDSSLLRQLAPTQDELQLLAHARQVNVDDRELSAGDSDGWFAVVMTNRLPTPGLRHRACLVSVEQRSDVIFSTPPQASSPQASGPQASTPQASGAAGPARTRLILLHSWTFTADTARPGGGSFKELSQNLDAGLFGSAAASTSTGHVTITLTDRDGGREPVRYRGPFAPQPVDRDTLGPYHSADQALRVAADTAVEDISYAAAFEVGRLLGAADARLAQELMRWRREAYLRAARTNVAATVWNDVPSIATTEQTALDVGLAAPVALAVFERASAGAGPPADVDGIQVVSLAPGLNPQRLAAAWNLSATQTEKLLARQPAGSSSGPAADPPSPATAATAEGAQP